MSADLIPSGGAPSVFGAALPVQTVIQYLIYIVAIVLVTVVVTLWIASGRVTLRQSNRRSDEHRRRRSARRWFGSADDKDDSGSKRRRRRRHRRRNPTLAETGGLPPIRTDASSANTQRNEP